jgi:hypothetical protein
MSDAKPARPTTVDARKQALTDAMYACDLVIHDIRSEHTIKRGWKAGQVSLAGEALVAAVKRVRDAILVMRKKEQP